MIHGVEVIIVDNEKWLNEKHIEKQLDRSTFNKTIRKYAVEFRKQRQELLENCINQPCRRFIRENLAVHLIMDCRTIPAVSFRKKLEFNQYDPIMTQEQSVLAKIKSAFSTEEIIFQHSVLGYRIDVYFLKHKLAIEVDEQGHEDRNFKCEIKRQEAVGEKLSCKFIRINPAKENFNIFDEICRIHHYIVESNEKLNKESLIDKI